MIAIESAVFRRKSWSYDTIVAKNSVKSKIRVISDSDFLFRHLFRQGFVRQDRKITTTEFTPNHPFTHILQHNLHLASGPRVGIHD